MSATRIGNYSARMAQLMSDPRYSSRTAEIVARIDEEVLAELKAAERLDEWNPDQPRDEQGKFAAVGTQEGAVKSGSSAIAKAQTMGELETLGAKVAGSKLLESEGKADLYHALGAKAAEMGDHDLADSYAGKAEKLAPAKYKESLKDQWLSGNPAVDFADAVAEGEEGKDYVTLADGQKALVNADGEYVITTGEVLPSSTPLAGAKAEAPKKVSAGLGGDLAGELKDSDLEAAAKEKFEALGVKVTDVEVGEDSVTVETDQGVFQADFDESSDSLDFEHESLATAPEDKPIDNSTITLQMEDVEEAGIEEAIMDAMGSDVQIELGDDDTVTVTTKDGKVYKGAAGTDSDQISLQQVSGSGVAAGVAAASGEEEKKSSKPDDVDDGDDGPEEKENPPANSSKSPEHVAHAKAARDHAKAITSHAKDLRAQLKKDPSNKALADKVAAAEKAAKAARSAARKAEKAKTPEEAAKHAAAAAKHYEAATGKTAAKAPSPSASKAAPTESKSTPAAKGSWSPSKEDLDAVAATTAKLQKAAQQKPPAGWSPEKVAAKAAADKALAEHANAKTPEELEAAAKAYDKVAKEAKAAGSLWGSQYEELADQARAAATKPVQGSAAHDPSVAPSESARPIESIKGPDYPLDEFKAARSAFGKKLTATEKSGVLAYSGNTYKSINEQLRDGKIGSQAARIKAIDSAISKAPLPRDMTLHRGTDDFKLPNGMNFSDLKPGDSFVEPAYSSTSAGSSAAFSHKDVRMVISAPKGYPAAPIPSANAHENEMLLRRNSRFKVTKREKIGSKVVLHVTLIHDKKED